MHNICVFCGSSPGFDDAYAQAATVLGETLVRNGLGLVFGGGQVGLMGKVADAVMAAGGRAVGVIPRALAVRELMHTGLTKLHVVESMHERKALMAALSDGFIALPGGLGTFEEFFEVLTWAQLGLHQKPCALLDVRGYYSPLVAFVDHSCLEGFVRAEHRDMFLVDEDPQSLLDRMRTHAPPQVPKWLRRFET